MTVTLGFDVGTTRTKALIYDTTEQRVLGSVSEATPVRTGEDGDQRDANDMWAVLARLCLELSRVGAPLHRVTGVSLAALGEEIVFLDERGLPIGPVSCWYVEHPSDDVAHEDKPPFRLASWYAIRNAYRRGHPALNSAKSFTDLGSSLLCRMVGAEVPYMDRSHASRTGLLDRASGDWSPARLHSCGIDRLIRPTLVDSGTRIGRLDAQAAGSLGLPEGVRVLAGAHDHICAALAAGAEQDGDFFVSVGTSESRLVLLDVPWSELSDREQPGCEIGFFADGRYRYLHTSSPSGRRVADLVSSDPAGRDIVDIYAALARMIATDPDGELDIPADAAGTDPTAAELFAELDRQAQASAAALNDMAGLSGGKKQRVRIIGVPAQHEIWRRIRQHRSDCLLDFIQLEEPAAIGAALLAAGTVDRPNHSSKGKR